jgi:hypothetical protein
VDCFRLFSRFHASTLGPDVITNIPIPFGSEDSLEDFVSIFYGMPLADEIGLRECLVLFIILELCRAHELADQVALSLARVTSDAPPVDGFDEWLYEVMIGVKSIPAGYFDIYPDLECAQYDLFENIVAISGIPGAVCRLWQKHEVEQMLQP